MGVDIRLFHRLVKFRGWFRRASWTSTHRIPGVDAPLVSVLNNVQRLLLIQDPALPLLATKAHGAQDDLGDLQARFAKAKAYRKSAFSPGQTRLARGPKKYRVYSISLPDIVSMNRPSNLT